VKKSKTIKTIKKIVKLFLPPILLEIWKTIKHGNCGSHASLQQGILPQLEHHSDNVIIMGNGPSLNDSIIKYKDEILKNDRIAVNFFASSVFFEQLKPNIYVFADPAFFDIPKDLKESIELLLGNLLQKTVWDMRVVVPSSARDSYFISKLKSNNSITVDYYMDYNQNIGLMSKFEAWDKNLIAPPAQTVLNVALFLSLYWNYKESYLIGADSSFFEDLRVDQKTNELFSNDTHFYNNQQVNSGIDSKRSRLMSGWTLHDLIYAYGRMFEYYSDLKDYADYKGLKVYNASEYSWINVFERRKLK